MTGKLNTLNLKLLLSYFVSFLKEEPSLDAAQFTDSRILSFLQVLLPNQTFCNTDIIFLIYR